jgi:predicted nuclease of restriction endonuclease-like (RecB) superfamily
MKKQVPKKSPAPRKTAVKSKSYPLGSGLSVTPVSPLFDRVATILDNARSSAVRAVNGTMVIAYWLIGREIVLELQGGDDRAEYGKQIIKQLSDQLTARFGRGFSSTNLRYFRTFFLTYSSRVPEIRHIGCGKSFDPISNRHTGSGVLEDLLEAVEQVDAERGFSDLLGWSHYRALMKVEHRGERLFYEIEAAACGWEVSTLERQIHTFLFARLLKSKDKAGVFALATEGQTLIRPIDAIKDPYILDFLALPESEKLHEQGLESAIISNLQAFLLELGKGFAFIARQKRMSFDDNFFYIDLVFYHCILKCYVLIDLKIGELTHQDIGQMDGYVRMWDDLGRSTGDNPTIGLILCTEKSQTIARYSVLQESQQLFASKYRFHLPTEEELAAELQREIRAIQEGRVE